MSQEFNDYVSPQLLLSSVLTEVDDENCRKGLTLGYYTSKIQEALELLSVKTYWQTVTLDSPMPENLIFSLPKDCFNVKEIYMLQTGCCDVELSANVYWKRNFNNMPDGKGYTAQSKGSGQQWDPYFQYGYQGTRSVGGQVLYANFQNGSLMFSNSCSGYPKFRLVYTSMGGNIGDVPIIPRPLRHAIVDYVKYKAFKSMEVRNPRSLYGKLAQDTYQEMYNLRSGSWIEAENFMKTSDIWKKNSQEQYFGRPNI